MLSKRTVSNGKDEFNRPVKGQESWSQICRCRCDDNSTRDFDDGNGRVFRPSYHIVCEGNADVKAGDYVRCQNGDVTRGEGKVYMVTRANYFSYTELWV